MKLIFLGAPGAGKGTQAAILSKRLGIPSISTGNILRHAQDNGELAGLIDQEALAEGELVSDEIIIKILAKRLAQSDCAAGYILDGAPRTITQAEAMEEAGIHFDAVISLEVPDEVITSRMSGRRVCGKCGLSYHVQSNPPKVEGKCDKCGAQLSIREDDAPETVKHRLAVYHEETEPLKTYYTKKGILKTIPSQPSIEETTVLVERALGL